MKDAPKSPLVIAKDAALVAHTALDALLALAKTQERLDDDGLSFVQTLLPILEAGYAALDQLNAVRPVIKPDGAHFRVIELSIEANRAASQSMHGEPQFYRSHWPAFRDRLLALLPADEIAQLDKAIISEFDQVREKLGILTPTKIAGLPVEIAQIAFEHHDLFQRLNRAWGNWTTFGTDPAEEVRTIAKILAARQARQKHSDEEGLRATVPTSSAKAVRQPNAAMEATAKAVTTNRDRLFPLKPVPYQCKQLCNDLWLAANFALAYLGAAWRMSSKHLWTVEARDRQMNAGCIAADASIIAKFVRQCQEAIRAVSQELTSVRQQGPFRIGHFAEENAHWVAYRIGIDALTRLKKCLPVERILEIDTEVLGQQIIDHWEICKEEMMIDVPANSVEAEVKWEATRVARERAAERPIGGNGEAQDNMPTNNSINDGPITEGYFYIAGKPYQFSNLQWRLLKALWNKESVAISSIGDEVYEGEDLFEGKLKKLVSDTNSKLLKLNLRFEIISPMSGHYVLRKLPPVTSEVTEK